MPVNHPNFNRDNAKAYAAKSAQVRRARILQRKAELLVLPKPETKPELVQGLSIACLRTRLQQVDELIACCRDPENLDRLTRAFERLFRVWQVLTETPDPGRLQPRTKKSVIIDQHLLGPISDLTPQPVVSSPGTDPASSVSGSDSNPSD